MGKKGKKIAFVYICNACKETDTHSGGIKAHQNEVHRKSKYKCGKNGCLCRFETKSELTLHGDTHTSKTKCQVEESSGTCPVLTDPRETEVPITYVIFRKLRDSVLVNWVVEVIPFSQTSEVPPQSLLAVTVINRPSVSVTMEERVRVVPSNVIVPPISFWSNPWLEIVVTGVTNRGNKDVETSHVLTRDNSGSSISSESHSLTLRPEENTSDNTSNGSGRNPYRFEGAAVVQEAIAEGHGEVGPKELMHISKGLETKERKNTDPTAAPFARGFGPGEFNGLGEGASLLEVVLKAMRDSYSSRPAIFAMSNLTKNADCTDAFKYAVENNIFASGNPFENGNLGNGKAGHGNQANNMYLFPGIGLGTLLSDARVSDGILLDASECLASYMTNEEIKNGILYPSIQSIRHITTEVGAAIMQEAHGEVGSKELMDMSKGLVTKNIVPAAAPFSRGFGPGEVEGLREGASLHEMVKKVRSHVLLGLSGIGGIFNEEDTTSTIACLFVIGSCSCFK